MKRKLALFAIVLAVLMLIPAFALAAESDETAPLYTIEMTSGYGLTKTAYTVGDTYNPSGIVINAQYYADIDKTNVGNKYNSIGYSTSNGFSTVMDGHVIDGHVFTKDDVGEKTITVQYSKANSTATLSLQITVTDVKDLKALVAENAPTKQYYFVGETFDKSGISAKATFDKSSRDYSVTPAPSPEASTTTQSIPASQLSVESHTFTADDAGKAVSIKVSYTYNGKTLSYPVEVYVYALTDFGVTTQPKKQAYYCGETFDKTGTEFEAKYDVNVSGKSKPVTKTISINNVFIDGKTYDSSDVKAAWDATNDKPKANEINITATFTYGDTTLEAGKTSAGAASTEYAPIKTYVYTYPTIDVTKDPYKTEYLVGEGFNPAGMVVTGTFVLSDADAATSKTKVTKVLAGYSYSKAPFTTASSTGGTSVKVYYTYAGKTNYDTVTVTVKDIAGEYIYLDKSSLFMTAGDTKKINATILPENTTYDDDDISWTVKSDTAGATENDVIAVDKNGVVSAIAEGSSYVIATLKSRGTSSTAIAEVKCYVNVVGKTPITSIKFSKTSMDLLLGDSTKLEPTIVPTDATVSPTWLSSNSNIVSVSGDGIIKGLKEGSAVVSVNVDGLEAKMNINVAKTLTTSGTVVNCQRRVNVRAKASGSSSSIGYAYLGQTYKILGEVDNWYKIQFTSSKIGYIWKKYLSSNGGKDYTPIVEDTTTTTTTDTTTTTTTTTTADATITAGTTSATTATKVTIVNCSRYIYIRKGASTAYSKLGHAVPGAVFTLKGASGDWYAIDYNGQVGYIFKDFCQLG